LFFEFVADTELTNPKGLGISVIVRNGIPKLVKIGDPELLNVCLFLESGAETF